jgi:hypothetical protein
MKKKKKRLYILFPFILFLRRPSLSQEGNAKKFQDCNEFKWNSNNQKYLKKKNRSCEQEILEYPITLQNSGMRRAREITNSSMSGFQMEKKNKKQKSTEE